MSGNETTAVVQRYLDALGGDTPADPTVRVLLDRTVCGLEALSAQMLYREYPRLARSPLGLEPDDVLGAWSSGCSWRCAPYIPGPCASSSRWRTRACDSKP